jgi:hypothetical protein
MPKLPTLIFVDEKHSSPLLGNILSKLAPRFKQLGYESYYDEYPSNLPYSQAYKALTDEIQSAEESI